MKHNKTCIGAREPDHSSWIWGVPDFEEEVRIMRDAEREFEETRLQMEKRNGNRCARSSIGILIPGTLVWLVVLIVQSLMGASILKVFASAILASVACVTLIIAMQFFLDKGSIKNRKSS